MADGLFWWLAGLLERLTFRQGAWWDKPHRRWCCWRCWWERFSGVASVG